MSPLGERRSPALAMFVVLALLAAGVTTAAERSIRLGWQVPWATQGQLVQSLAHTNIPELTDIDLKYVGFSYGGPLNRAALAGEIDVLLTADQPALVLMARSPGFRVVARMMYNRVCLYVPPTSKIQTLGDLAGRRLMGPVGAAAERVALGALREAGVDLKGMQLGSLDMEQQSALLERAVHGEWASVDALYGFDPMPAVFESKGKARMLYCDKVLSLVLASPEMIENRGPELSRFLRAFALSWAFYAREPKLANSWFFEESRLNVGDDVLDRCASVEPNRWVKSPADLRLDLTEDDYQTLASALEFLREREIVREPLDYRAAVDLTPLRRALDGFDLVTESARVTAKPRPAD